MITKKYTTFFCRFISVSRTRKIKMRSQKRSHSNKKIGSNLVENIQHCCHNLDNEFGICVAEGSGSSLNTQGIFRETVSDNLRTKIRRFCIYLLYHYLPLYHSLSTLNLLLISVLLRPHTNVFLAWTLQQYCSSRCCRLYMSQYPNHPWTSYRQVLLLIALQTLTSGVFTGALAIITTLHKLLFII